MRNTAERNIGDGADLANAALHLLEEWHGLCVHYVASEWAVWESADEGPAACPEASGLYDAAIAVVCRWYGITNAAGFRRYLSRFAAEGRAGHE
jgi:hypothetical protein